MKKLIIGRIGNHETISLAADELKRLLCAIDSSLDIEIAEKSYDAAEKNVIWVGVDPAFGIEADEINDTVYIDVKDLCGAISGSGNRAVLIAVYRFARELGCRFIRPGKSGEIIPEKELSGATVSLKETASYPHRGVCIEGADSYENILDMIDFLPKVGMNEYFIQFMVPTEFFVRWYEHRGSKVLKPEWDDPAMARPNSEKMTEALEGEIKKRSLTYHKAGHGWTCEPFGIDGCGWFNCEQELSEAQKSVLAEVNGKREMWGGVPLNTNLCYSNPEVRETINNAITEYAEKNPKIDIIHFWLADDSNNQCECDACVQKRPADWYMQMLNELDEKLSAKGLNTKIVFLIYVDLLWEPETEKLNNPDRFILMFAPITRNYGQNYGDCRVYDEELPSYERNKLKMPSSLAQNIEHLRRWQAGFEGDSFSFDYHLMWAHVGDIGYEKCAENLFNDMKDLHKIGLCGMVSCQVQRCFYPTALPFLAMAQALWDENADFNSFADDYYSTAFGKSASEVRAAMKALSLSCGLYENAQQMWDEEKAVCALDMLKAVVEKNPALTELKAYTEYLELLFAFFRTIPSKNREVITKAADPLFDWIWNNEMALQSILDAQNSILVFNRLIDRVCS